MAEIDDAGDRHEHAPVWIADDGTFQVPYAGNGRYRLRPVLGYLDVPARIVRGGDEVTFADGRVRPWLRLRLEGPEVEGAPSPACASSACPRTCRYAGSSGSASKVDTGSFPCRAQGATGWRST